MKIIADVCVVPIGVGVSVSKYIAECQQIFEKFGLKHEIHAYGTNLEGEWSLVMNAIEECHSTLHEMGAPRITTNIRIGSRIDREQTMEDKIESVKKLVKS